MNAFGHESEALQQLLHFGFDVGRVNDTEGLEGDLMGQGGSALGAVKESDDVVG